ncbi:stalk domain-containing protein [Tepidibacter thalassicus]|uniref:Copper amine oxidase N-terminal domain-containing protein n=1 Tax=Tepidibacter thalassicus DSM 15285 TaxID=1123350 RepID=A0A1M5SAC2_9FIRM|nr:stalk domain-containing protein [Tepidibacter thalassicus]SHH35446.1 Copper amine oxidase N-terminal domain-containing protein [Tepidibacter thalassicus DSM 15285]
MNIKKNIIAKTLVGVVLATSISPIFADEKNTDYLVPVLYEKRGINVIVDGKNIVFSDEKPMILDGRTIVPIEFLSENLGVKITWDKNKKVVNVETEYTDIKMTVEDKEVLIYHKYDLTGEPEKIKLDVPATVIDDNIYVPLRFISAVVGYNIIWNESTQTVILNKSNVSKIKNEIKLKENPTTGYVWHYDIENKDIVEVVFDSFKGSEKSNICGMGGEHIWKLKGLKEGSTIIKFDLYRDSEGKEQSIDTKEYIVNVSSQLELSIKEKENVFAGGSEYFDEATGLYKMIGKVKKIQNNKFGVMALVEGNGMYDKIKFMINEDTEIVTTDGIKLGVNDLQNSSNIIVYHDAKMTRSLPPIANAKKIIVKDIYCKEGEISQIEDIKEGKIIFIGKNMNEGIKFNVSNKTDIVNEQGEKLSIKDIKEGIKVKIYHSPIMTMSLPPITNAEKIIIMSSN